jgi:uncharacterized protein YcfJ
MRSFRRGGKWCRRRDLNPHGGEPHRILSPTKLLVNRIVRHQTGRKTMNRQAGAVLIRAAEFGWIGHTHGHSSGKSMLPLIDPTTF